MQYAVLLYADSSLDAGPGSPEWDSSAPAHGDLAQRFAAGGHEFSGAALHGSGSATSVRRRNGETLVTDGPFAETKEQLGGFWIIDVADLDAALDLAAKGSIACGGPVEVRPFQELPED